MLTFLRKIRKSLIHSGSTRKPASLFGRYLIYAVGEIALVVVGILIALSINNWNQEQKAHKFEDLLLMELRNDIIYDYSEINRVLDGNKHSKSSCQTILDHFDLNLPYHDSLNFHFWKANHWWQLNLRKTAFENTQSYGLHFIKDDSLRMLLTMVYQNDTDWWDDNDSRLAQYHYNVVEPYLLNLFESTALNSDMIPHDYKMLRTDQKYRTILKTNIGNRRWFEMIVKDRFLGGLKELDRRILDEIENR